MMPQVAVSDTTLYRVLIVDREAHASLVLATVAGYQLPAVTIPRHRRVAEEVRNALHVAWGLHAFVVGTFCDTNDAAGHYALIELLVPHTSHDLIWVSLEQVLPCCSTLREVIASSLTGTRLETLPYLGWLSDVIGWVESVTQLRVANRRLIEQLQVGQGFCLMKFYLEDGRACWFKAIGRPNRHETAITQFLACNNEQTARFLPAVLAVHEEWNALLLEDGAMPLYGLLNDSRATSNILADVVVSLARLQRATVSSSEVLLGLGAADQDLLCLAMSCDRLGDYLEHAMSLQTSVRAPQLEPVRMRHICTALKHACERTIALGIPKSLIHGDLNPGNILRGQRCIFIDWSEAYIGCPLVSLQHVFLLARLDDETEREVLRRKLISRYCEEWNGLVPPERMNTAVRFMPLLAAASTLYGRGDWFDTADCGSPSRLAFARTLARHMDRAVTMLEREVA